MEYAFDALDDDTGYEDTSKKWREMYRIGGTYHAYGCDFVIIDMYAGSVNVYIPSQNRYLTYGLVPGWKPVDPITNEEALHLLRRL